LCAKEIHRLGPIDLKNLYPSKKPVTVTRQLTSSVDYLCDFYLCNYLTGKPNNGTSPTASANASPVTGRSGKEHNDNLGKSFDISKKYVR
jgi:hypothetical protein